MSAELTPGIVLCCFFTAAGGKPSWTAKLLSNPELLCKKVGRGMAVACMKQADGSATVLFWTSSAVHHYHIFMSLRRPASKQSLAWQLDGSEDAGELRKAR